ncbi:MAG: hypothetical protein II754_02010 [Lachnospiraceae bacterium]|nr:hypothetical protein [Lachnospiraceae bacterium]
MKQKRVIAILAAGFLLFSCGCGDDHDVSVSGVPSRPEGSIAIDYGASGRTTSSTESETAEAAASESNALNSSEASSEGGGVTEAAASESQTSSSAGGTASAGVAGAGSSGTEETTAPPAETGISEELAGDGSAIMVFPDKKKYEYEQEYMEEDFVDFDYKVTTEWSDAAATNTGNASLLIYAPSSDDALNAALAAAEKSKVTVVVYGHAPVKTRARAWFVTYDPNVKGDKEVTYGQEDEEAILKELTDGKIKSVLFKDPDYFIEVVEDISMSILDGETPDADDIEDGMWDADCSFSTEIAPAYTIKPLVVTMDNVEAELVDEGYYDVNDDGSLTSDW